MFALGFRASLPRARALASMRRLSTAPSLPTILYMDGGILAINKPHGFICQYDMHKEVRYGIGRNDTRTRQTRLLGRTPPNALDHG